MLIHVFFYFRKPVSASTISAALNAHAGNLNSCDLAPSTVSIKLLSKSYFSVKRELQLFISELEIRV
jgi:hypothetical protein